MMIKVSPPRLFFFFFFRLVLLFSRNLEKSREIFLIFALVCLSSSLSRLSLQKFSGSILLAHHTPNSFLFKGSLLCGRERERERTLFFFFFFFFLSRVVVVSVTGIKATTQNEREREN